MAPHPPEYTAQNGARPNQISSNPKSPPCPLPFHLTQPERILGVDLMAVVKVTRWEPREDWRWSGLSVTMEGAEAAGVIPSSQELPILYQAQSTLTD